MTTQANKIWFITGCSGGLGRALAEVVLAGGGFVAATSRSPDKLASLHKEYPESFLPVSLDITNATQVKVAIESVVAQKQRLDVVVNNAGYGLIGSLEECTEEQIRQNFDVNVHGALNVIRAALPVLRAQRSGHIFNVSAAAAISNYAGFSIYGGAKYALEGISEGLAAELKPLGIKVSLIQPGPFRTDFVSGSMVRADASLPDYTGTVGKFDAYLQKMDGRQPGDPRKAAEAIVEIATIANPPFRIALGKYALTKAERVLNARLRELELVKSLKQETDFT